jgi:hypothetical protein
MTLEPSDSPAVRSAKQVRAGRLAPHRTPPARHIWARPLAV